MVGWVFIALVLLAIYIVFELMKVKHGVFSIFLIVILLLFLLSLVFVFRNNHPDLNTFGGIKDAAGVYVDWLGLTWNNFRSLTGNAAKTDWNVNKTKSKTK